MEISQALFARPGKTNILGFVVLVVSTSPERLPRGPFANNNDQVTGLRGPTHEKTKQYCSAPLCVPAQFRQHSGTAQTPLLVTRAKCPTKDQHLENQLTKEMEAAVRRNLMFVVYPKERQEELSLPAANS